MARYKPIDTNPRFIAIDLERQLLPGTFESHREAGASRLCAVGKRRGGNAQVTPSWRALLGRGS